MSAPGVIALRQQRAGERPPTRFDAVLLDTSLRQMLVCARSLGRAGYTVAGLDWWPPRSAPAAASRWCSLAAPVPDVALDADAFVDAVLAFIRRHPSEVLLPAHDGSIAAIRSRRADLDADIAVALAPEPALGIAVDKAQTLAVARELGIAVPRGVQVGDPSQTRAALAEVGLPAVVKPLESWVSSGGASSRLRARDATTAAEAEALVEAALHAGGHVVIQEWAPGAREAVSFLHSRGRFHAEFAQVAYRMDPPLGGASVLRESIPPPPDAREAGRRLVTAIGLDGYSEIEFRRDRAGRPLLMEINPRLSASVEVAVRAGVDFPRLLHAWAAGRPMEEFRGYRTGVRMRWLGGDLHWLASVLVRADRPDAPPRWRALRDFLADFGRPTSYDYLDSSDLRPAWVAVRAGVERFVARGASELVKMVRVRRE